MKIFGSIIAAGTSVGILVVTGIVVYNVVKKMKEEPENYDELFEEDEEQ